MPAFAGVLRLSIKADHLDEKRVFLSIRQVPNFSVPAFCKAFISLQ